MNTKKLLNKKFLILSFIIVVLFSVFVLIITQNPKRNNIADMEYSELNDSIKNQMIEDVNDLINVDYEKYYDELKDDGEWIKINLGEYLKNNKKTETISDKISECFLKMTGVNNAYADDGFYMNTFFVWRPSPGFAVGIAAGENEPVVFTPYTYGRWVYTDFGWYFRAPTYEAEIVHHYGRWVFVPTAGWVWVPGRKWAPAWVHWEYDNDYIAWTPLVPNIYYVNNYVYVPPVYINNNFVVVERKYFVYPDLHKHIFYGSNGNLVIKEKLKIKDNKYFYNYSVRNNGPHISNFENSSIKWKMKQGDVDFVNRNIEDRKSFRNNTVFEKNNGAAENHKRGQNERNEKSGIDRKQGKNERFKNDNIVKDGNKQKYKTDKQNREVTGKSKEKIRDSNMEKKQKNQNDKNITEKRKERGNKDFQSGKNRVFGSERNKDLKSGKNKEFSGGKNREFKSPDNNRNFNTRGANEFSGSKTQRETGKNRKQK